MSLRTALLVLAIVPGVALASLWAVTSVQTLTGYQRQAAQGESATNAGQPSVIMYYSLQEERRLSADVLGGNKDAEEPLRRQRALTDDAIESFQTFSDVVADDDRSEVREAVRTAHAAIAQLPSQRALVDKSGAGQQQAVYTYYSDLIGADLGLFGALSHVDDGPTTSLSQTLVDLFYAKEMVSRSDALLTRGWAAGKLGVEEFAGVEEAIMGQPLLYTTQVVPYLSPDEKATWDKLVGSSDWKTKTRLENRILRSTQAEGSDFFVLDPDDEKAWRGAIDGVDAQLEELLELRLTSTVEKGNSSVRSLLLTVTLTTAVGLLAVIAVIWTTWRLTRNLRRRISSLQERAEELEKALPDVVDRLALGERIDVETEARAIEHDAGNGGDELTRLGDALNLARTSALSAAVKQADQHRGFERLLQRIARRTQQLIGQQLRKLDDLERKHEDPEILEDLFDLDHLTARLRRYEENLVILAGGTPHRRWRKPVPLLDVMRSAQGEVQDYRRVALDLNDSPWLAERAVGPVTHVLAELIENALSFSRPPNPVEVRAAKVSRGLAIEVEDRGLGMDDEQLAAANELMARPPRMDVLAHSEDIRLGLYVIARLANQHGLRVEFRSSAYGGTRVVLLVPDELIVPGPNSGPVVMEPPAAAPAPAPASAPAPAPETADGQPLPTRVQGRALADVTAIKAAGTPYAEQPHQSAEQPRQPGPTPYPAAQDQPYAAPENVAPAAPHDPAPQERYGAPAPGGDPYAAPPVEPFAPQPHPSPYGTDEQPYMTAAGQYPVDPPPSCSTPAGTYQGPEQPYPAPYSAGAEHGRPARLPVSEPDHPAPPDPEAVRTGNGSGRPAPGTPPTPGTEPPLPRRVRQASLVDELRVGPAARNTVPRPPGPEENPQARPAPHRAGAAIGAFQRRSRAARATSETTPRPAPPATPHPTREEPS
ncbi:nitrate- and nitrite sensing domain-containing protein [Streptomyces sp. ML-6]|uniref:sensor histidine kinase n=1 Tax=Streptomyces sp. ML-6 TaxID=2982693 RepID=UPI0024BFEB79|nr:nitrate- and nitrite sensing domain-containing protein [Streptomyces sp. ML-6]MDK0522831.1 nitrate- and nitrite sensing domain-containing protein [Streptomyces sp. ML-6]